MQTQDGGRGSRRAPEDYDELRGLLAEADALLGDHDPRGAGEALKRAGVKAAAMWGGVGVPALPGPVRDLISLIGETQDLAASGDGLPEHWSAVLGRLDGLRDAFEREAERETGRPRSRPAPDAG